MSVPDPPPVDPLPLRGLRLAALGLQAAVAALLLLLGLAAAPTPLRDPIQLMLVHWSPSGPDAPGWIFVACAGLGLILVAAGLLLVSWRLQSRSWWRIALGYSVLGVLLAYLAHDDPTIRRPVRLEDISPAFPGAEASFNVLMRYGREHPLGKNFKAPAFKDPYPVIVPSPPGPWRVTVTARRAEFEAHWAQLAPERAWLTELNAFDRIGDMTPARVDAELLGFQSIRAVSQHGIAIASLQALDGRGNDAVDTLLPILQVGRKLQPYSRTLVRSMIGVVIEHISLDTASFILDNAAVSPAAQARLAAALSGGDPEAGARHLLSTEYAFHLGAFKGAPIGDILAESGLGDNHPCLRRAFNAASPFVYNPRATFNLYGDLYADLQDLNGRRQIARMNPRMKEFIEQDARPSLKNPLGKLLAKMAVPAYTKVSENYWRNQDQRAALLARLLKQLADAASGPRRYSSTP